MISVIIPTYNREKTIKRAIESVLNQTYKDIELIVVDDGSTDNTEKVVISIKDARLKYVKQKNAGACAARNYGINLANGKYISFLDSDDEWNPNKLETQYKYLKLKKADVVVCNYEYEKNGKRNIAFDKGNDSLITLDELLNKNYITTGALLLSKKVFDKVGIFDESMPRYQDWELALRIAKKYKIYFLNEPLLTLYFQENSITNSTSKEKKYIALEKMYNKNEEEFKNNKQAYAHICWSLGMYSLYTDTKRYDLLKKGIIANGLNLKRFLIFISIKSGFKNKILKIYGKTH